MLSMDDMDFAWLVHNNASFIWINSVDYGKAIFFFFFFSVAANVQLFSSMPRVVVRNFIPQQCAVQEWKKGHRNHRMVSRW